MDQSLFAAPHSLSQRTTSFIASQRQGIHQIPLWHLIALIVTVQTRRDRRHGTIPVNLTTILRNSLHIQSNLGSQPIQHDGTSVPSCSNRRHPFKRPVCFKHIRGRRGQARAHSFPLARQATNSSLFLSNVPQQRHRSSQEITGYIPSLRCSTPRDRQKLFR